MNRQAKRTVSLVALTAFATLGLASVLGATAGGCVFSSAGSPETSICDALASFFQSCNVQSGCQAAFERDCSRISSALSAAAINAAFSCVAANETCGDAGSGLTAACTVTSLGQQGASPAQVQLASDFCGACEPQNSACANSFYFTDAGQAGTGLASLALAGDPTVQAVDAKCIAGLSADAGLGACQAEFEACATPIATAAFYLPTECINGDAGVP
jgi:hypothetical protein